MLSYHIYVDDKLGWLKHNYFFFLSKKRVLYLESDSELNVDIVVTNNGEEAHQARLTVWYPPDVVYVGFQPVAVSVPIISYDTLFMKHMKLFPSKCILGAAMVIRTVSGTKEVSIVYLHHLWFWWFTSREATVIWVLLSKRCGVKIRVFDIIVPITMITVLSKLKFC